MPTSPIAGVEPDYFIADVIKKWSQGDATCPLCGALREHHRLSEDCDGNIDRAVAAARAEIAKIEMRQSELPASGGATNIADIELSTSTVDSTLGLNQLSNSKMFSSFLFKNIEFEFGGDINTENDALGPQKRDIVLGGQFDLNLPGTVNFSILAYKEWNNNNFWAIPGEFSGDREFQWIPRLELLISEPLTFLPWPISWRSFTGVNFPKGTGISQSHLNALCAGACAGPNPFNAFSKTEVFEDNRLVLDATKLWWGKAGIWDLYVGYRYWYNKFGTDHNAPLFASSKPPSFDSSEMPGLVPGIFVCRHRRRVFRRPKAECRVFGEGRPPDDARPKLRFCLLPSIPDFVVPFPNSKHRLCGQWTPGWRHAVAAVERIGRLVCRHAG